MSSTLESRLLAGLRATPSGCWEWQGSRHPRGYGRIAIAHSTTERTHRVAFQLWIGPIPPGLFVCHRCDNPPCCNPEHLYAGTNRQNVDDAVAHGLMAKPRLKACRRGHPLIGANIYVRPDNGKRMCAACRYLAGRAVYERRYAAGLNARGQKTSVVAVADQIAADRTVMGGPAARAAYELGRTIARNLREASR